MKKISILFLILLCNCTFLYAQQFSITGVVTDKKLNEPIIGASVVVKGTTNGTVTDLDGKFTIQASKSSVLIVSFIGYTPQEFTINGNQTFYQISLAEDTQTLDEVVVVGFGTQKKVNLTGAVATVDKKTLESRPVTSVSQALQGVMPGLNIDMNDKGGRLDYNPTMNIRGTGNLNTGSSASPLVLIDGAEGDINSLNPQDIANISVLKDAAASAIYGSRGANGVILIQTKKGKKGAPTVSYKGQVGMQQAQHRIDMMKGAEYVKYTQDYNRMKYGYSGDQLDPLVLLNPSERANYQNGSELDWQDIMFRNALTTSHQISISGGTEATTYMASISHLREDGVMENTGLKRTNIALNITQVLNKWLTVGMGTQAIQKEFGGEQPFLEAGLKMSPYGIYKDENDRYVDYPMDQTLFYNPMANIDATNDKTNRNVFISTFAEIQFPIDGLSFRTNFGYNYRNNFVGSYYGRNTLSGKKVNGSASIENIHYYDYTWENLLKYNKTFGLHKIDATALFSMQETTNKEAKESDESFVNFFSE